MYEYFILEQMFPIRQLENSLNSDLIRYKKYRHKKRKDVMTTRKFITNPGADEMPTSADVVIIGGGPAGTAALWAIERAAPGTKTLLIEKSDRLGAGSSLASLENFRTCWPALPLAKQMRRSVDI